MPKRAAFLSMGSASDSWCIYDDMLVEPLKERGWIVDARVPWRQFRTIDWTQYDVVVVRSTWDYQDDLALFHQALEHITTSGRTVRVENDVALMRWNSSKLYMRDMAARGCPIIPTMFVADAEALERGVSANIAEALKLYDEVVIKPAVGASSFDTFRVSAADLHAPFTFIEEAAVRELRGRPTELENDVATFATKAAFFDMLYRRKPCLIQPFVPEIVTEGEFAVFFFGGAFSHAMQKVPQAGDFRVQEEYGAVHRAVGRDALPPGVLTCAAAAMEALDASPPPLYARIDVVRVSAEVYNRAVAAPQLFTSHAPVGPEELSSAQYALMEAELVEPSLYFNVDPAAVTNFCDAFCTRFGTFPPA
jgi:glutathione synthase/RimK-type ligase-like ATP-grasp enzyme